MQKAQSVKGINTMDIKTARLIEMLKLKCKTEKLTLNIEKLLCDSGFTENEISNVSKSDAIYARDCVSVANKIEFAAFARRMSDNEIEMVVVPQEAEQLCRVKLRNMMQLSSFDQNYIKGSVVIKKRFIVETSTGWEEV